MLKHASAEVQANYHVFYRATYSCPSFITPMSVDLLTKLPGEIVGKRRKGRLNCPGRSYHKFGMTFRCKSQELR